MERPHDSRYAFPEPESLREAHDRKRVLERDIMNIERQLMDRERRDRDGKPLSKDEYRVWHRKTRSVLIYKKVEQTFLKDWIVRRRREVQATEVGIFDPDDPREMLVQCRKVLRRLLDGEEVEEAGAGRLYDVIDQFLQHAA
jgi:hypothetical protein